MEVKIKNNETKKEVKSEKGLMALKKEELVNVILRKDDVEKKLKADIEELKLELDQARDQADGLDYQAANDKAEIFVLNNANKKLKRNIYIITSAFIVLLIVFIAMMCRVSS